MNKLMFGVRVEGSNPLASWFPDCSRLYYHKSMVSILFMFACYKISGWNFELKKNNHHTQFEVRMNADIFLFFFFFFLY